MQPSSNAPAVGVIGPAGDATVYGVLRDRLDAPSPMALTKSTLIALSHALEDECAAGEPGAVLFGAFQHARFHRGSQRRWSALAAQGRAAFVFARPDEQPVPPGVRFVALGPDSPLLEEWSVVVDGVTQPAALAAWERPGQHDVADRDRVFDALWTLRPALVRAASQALASVAEGTGHPEARHELAVLDGAPVADVARGRASERVYGRMLQVLTDHQLVANGRPSE